MVCSVSKRYLSKSMNLNSFMDFDMHYSSPMNKLQENSMKKFVAISLASLLLVTAETHADPRSIPVQIDYSFIKNALISQVYKGNNHSAELWKDRHGCGHLTLSNPNLSGQQGQVRMLNEVDALVGTHLGGQCLILLQWNGVLETLQQPTLDASGAVLKFPVTHAQAFDQQGNRLNIEKLQDLIKRFAEPRLAEVKIDLNDSRRNVDQTLNKFLPQNNVAEVHALLDSLKFNQVQAGEKGIKVKLQYDAANKRVEKTPAPVLNSAEQQQWQTSWQQWDAFFSNAIKQASDKSKSPEIRETLTEILLDSRTAVQAGIKGQTNDGSDPVRVFFTDTWVRLAPILKTLGDDLPGLQALRYLTFLDATDVIHELENIGAPVGLEISSEGLRRLARMVIAKQATQAKTSP